MSEKTPGFIEDDFAGKPNTAKPAAPAKPPIEIITAEERAMLDPEGLLTDAEIRDIRAKARADIMADKRTQLKSRLIEREKQRLKVEEGLTTGNSHQDEMVNITIDLPTFAPYINVNSTAYWHGRTYPVSRHVADSLRDQMHMSWKHQNQIDGKSLTDFYAQHRVANLDKITGSHSLSAKAVA